MTQLSDDHRETNSGLGTMFREAAVIVLWFGSLLGLLVIGHGALG
jgi:hypothetical protein